MFASTTKRRLRAFLRIFFSILFVFSLTLFICSIFVAVGNNEFAPFHLISPLSALQQFSQGDAVGQVKNLCNAEHLSCVSVSQIGDDTIQITLDSGTIVLLSTKKDIKNQLASLQSLIAQLTIKGKQLKQVDFRFVNTVASF